MKAKDFYRKALDNLDRAERQFRNAGRYDALTNVYFNKAWSHLGLNENDQACLDFDHTLEAYNENVLRNPMAKPSFPSRFSSLPESIAFAKKEARCPMPS